MKKLFTVLLAALVMIPPISEAGGSVVKSAPKVAKGVEKTKMPRRAPVTKPPVSRPGYHTGDVAIPVPCPLCNGSGRDDSGRPCSVCKGLGVQVIN